MTPQPEVMNQLLLVVGLIGGIITILGALVAVVIFIARISAKVAIHQQTLDKNVEDTTAAHDKIRKLDPVIQQHETSIQLVQKDVSYIREGIDELKTAFRDSKVSNA